MAESLAAKKVLMVSGNRIAPAETGGQLHSISIARALARLGHSVEIFSIAGRREDYAAAGLFRGVSLHACLEPRLSETTHRGLLFGMVQAITRRLDYPRIWQHAFLSRGFVPRRLKQALSWAEIVISDLPYCPRIPGPWLEKPWFLISHNLEHKLLEQGSPRQRRFAGWMRGVESNAPQEYSDILACAEEDRAFFRAHDKAGRLALPLLRCGVDPESYAVSAAMRARMRATLGVGDDDWIIIFSGSGFAPNVEAFEDIKNFCRAEADFLARNRVYFLVVGSVSPVAHREGALIVTGRVKEILDYFAAADAGINMVTRGSGSNVKLFEYLAAKLPVISTPFGVRGTELVPFADYQPCNRTDLRQVIERFISEERTAWRSRAEAVWVRHKRTCDIQDLVQDAVSILPAFHSAAG